MRAFTIIVASALAAFVNAQSSTTTTSAASASSSSAASAATTTSAAATTGVAAPSTQSQSMPPSATAGFNPNNVTTAQRTDWCRAQRNNCRAICGGGPQRNDCTEATLTYACTCYNGTVPDMTRYTDTLPYYICIATRDQCTASHPDDLAGQETCTSNAQCGTINPPAIEADTSSSSSGSGTPTSSGRASATTSTTSTSNAAVVFSSDVTTGAFAALLMAIFKFLL